jgi:hypothetical protein
MVDLASCYCLWYSIEHAAHTRYDATCCIKQGHCGDYCRHFAAASSKIFCRGRTHCTVFLTLVCVLVCAHVRVYVCVVFYICESRSHSDAVFTPLTSLLLHKNNKIFCSNICLELQCKMSFYKWNAWLYDRLYIYIYIYIQICVCVCVCESARSHLYPYI